MKVIGLTGSFGTGKTFVASVFRSLGARVLDADRIARDCLKKGRPAYSKAVRAFGDQILGSRGTIARSRLAAIVFADRKALTKLERIVHPEVIGVIKKNIQKSRPADVIVIDAPLLVEAKALGLVDKLVVVKCSKKRQIERCVRKHRIKKEEVLKRVANQMSLKKKIRMADFVIDSDRSKSRTRSQAERVWEEIVWR